MRTVKQLEIKNRTYYFYNGLINLNDFNASLLKIDKKSYKEIDIYYIGSVTVKKIGNYNNINSVNPLYLTINEANGHFDEKNRNKYLVLDAADKNEEVLKKYEEVWEGIKEKIEAINGNEKTDYGKDYKKIRFESNEDLPLNKMLKFHLMTVIIRCVFREDGKFYPQLFLDDCLYVLEKCYSTKELMFQKELTLIRPISQKNVNFVINGFLKMLDLGLNHMFVINVMIY